MKYICPHCGRELKMSGDKPLPCPDHPNAPQQPDLD